MRFWFALLPDPEPPAEPAPLPLPAEHAGADPMPDHVVEPPRPAPPADEADRLWELFADGREREAYDGLAELAVVRPDRAGTTDRFLREARAMAAVRHDHVVDKRSAEDVVKKEK